MVYGIAGQNIAPGMGEESFAASSAMVVSGLEKELRPTNIKMKYEDAKIDMEKAEEFIQQLVDSTAVERIKKYDGDEEKKREKKEESPKKKRAFIGSQKGVIRPFEWAERPKDEGVFSFLFNLENNVLRGILMVVLQPEIRELIDLAKDLKIDISGWKLEKVNIDSEGNLLLASGLTEEEKGRILLLDECKILEIGNILEDSWLKLLIINWRLLRVKLGLKRLGLTKEDLQNIKKSAQQIAFLKLIAILKDAHLNRVFSGSKKEFEAYSRKIRKLTKKIWKLNVNFPQIGMDWIHKKLETLALESAKYKLELLKSMQKVAYDPANEVTIHWLETTIAHF